MHPPTFDRAEDLERHLGDPVATGDSVRSLESDEAEAFPAAACDALDDWGLPRYYVPRRHGGALSGYDEVLMMMRAVARRDLTVAIGHGKTYLGSVCVWVGGSPELADRVGRRVATGAVVALGLTERGHGSDLLSNEFRAIPVAGGYRLTGEKWMINNATRGDLLCVLATTDPGRGPRAQSLFLVDKSAVAVRCLPKIATHGIRGADISGFALTDAPVPAANLIGERGHGLEILLKALQITRTMCTSLSLGAGDSALRLAAGFAAGRRLYGRCLDDMPVTREVLTDAYADLLLAEVTALGAARVLNTMPGEASVSSAVAKYLAPTLMDKAIARLARLLGARSLLLDHDLGGAFQKLERDHRIVGIFDGNTLVNLQGLVLQGPVLDREYRAGHPRHPALDSFADVWSPGEELDPRHLRLSARRGSSVLNALPAAVTDLADRLGDAAAAVTAARRIAVITDDVHRELAVTAGRPEAIGPENFHAARRYAVCFAAAAAIHLYLGNADRMAGTGPGWQDATWLQHTLERALQHLGDPAPRGPADGSGPFWDALTEQSRSGLSYSLFPLPIADREPAQAGAV